MPFTVSAVTTANPNGYMRNRLIFYADVLFWIFYVNGTDGVWRTSNDGDTWSDESIWRLGAGVASGSVWYDGTFVHIAWAQGTDVFYRRGLLNSDGTITWSAAWQTAYTEVGCDAYYPVIIMDSNNQPWIGFARRSALLVMTPYVTMSTATDGTWTTGAGFPYELSAAITGDHVYAIPVALTGGNVYVVYGTHNTTIRGQLYDVTTGWGAEEVASTSNINSSLCSPVAIGDDVHLIFESRIGVNYAVTYLSRVDGTWGSETALSSQRNYNVVSGLAVDADTNYLYAFWADSGSIYMQVYNTNGWSGVITVVSGEGTWPDEGGKLSQIKVSYQKYGRTIMFTWVNGTASPYSLRFDTLSLLESSVKTAPNSGL